MSRRVTDSKIIYIRFRKDLDDLISQEALRTNTHKATLVGSVLTEYIRTLSSSCQGRITSLNKTSLGFSSLSSSFFVKHGRSVERVLGKPMRVTLKMVDEGNMRLAALSTGYTITQFRTAIMVTWVTQNNLL